MSFISSLATQIAPQVNTIATAAKQIASTAEDAAKRARVKATAENFEASFMSVMMQQMFDGVKTSAPFGGGQGEEMFKSVLTDAMSKQITKAGGVGLASTIQREMLKLQGLKE
ncbi:rod-binding protein [uncultured Caulobacter sp.]|uniref:rod-binding protein n=1 Tax=uncultured Caulobacter sp. TaxID=158749 RepID=UPI0026046D91|nr:rod-binding protein [uncultured Caulobacter sp.]